jgi:hypothetical protein
MPYNNEYNQKISDIVMNNNNKYINNEKENDMLFHHTDMPLRQKASASKKLVGSAIPKEIYDDIKYGINQGVRIVYGDASQYGSNDNESKKIEQEEPKEDKIKVGGGGYAKGSFRDTGYEKVEGAGVKKYVKKVKLTKKMEGGTELGLPKKLVGEGGAKKRGRPSKMLNTEKNESKKSEKMKGGKLVPVANMKSSSMAGQGKKKGNRADIVKQVMKDKKMSMIEASSYVKKNNLY